MMRQCEKCGKQYITCLLENCSRESQTDHLWICCGCCTSKEAPTEWFGRAVWAILTTKLPTVQLSTTAFLNITEKYTTSIPAKQLLFCKLAETLSNEHLWAHQLERSLSPKQHGCRGGLPERHSTWVHFARLMSLLPTVDFLCREFVWHAQAAYINILLKGEEGRGRGHWLVAMLQRLCVNIYVF